MFTSSIFKKAAAGFAAVAAGLIISTGSVHALIPYQGDQTQASPVPAFNVFTGNIPAPAPAGGEQDFFRGRVPVNGDLNEGTTQYSDPVTTDCTDGKVIQMHIYVHNGASVDGNNNGSGPSVAHNTHVKVALPGTQGSAFTSTASISASNAATVTDNQTIKCSDGKTVKLQYVSGSASQYSAGSGVLKLSDAIVGAGVPIQSEKTPGDVWGCWNERVYVVLAVKVVEVPQPKPEVTATCDMFQITATEDRKVRVSAFKYSAQNADVKNVTIDWGDNSQNTVVTNAGEVVGQTHQYSDYKTYLINAIVTFNDTVNNKEIRRGGAGTSCATQVTFTKGKPPVVPPTITTTAKPTQLVNTGAGSVMGLFAAATAAGAVIYRKVMARRLSDV